MQKKIEGVIAVPLTPFDQDGNIDYTAIEEIIEFMIGKGIHGMFPCGSVSLGPLMKPEERKQVLEFIVKVNQERVPIIAQIGAADTRTAVDLARHAQSLRVDAVASIPPFYIPTDEEAIYEHFKEIKEAVEIPVYAYNNLWTGKIISPRLFKRLVDLGYQGMKDAGENILLHYNYLRIAPSSFNLLMGNETLALPAFAMGINGFTSGTVNAFPELNLELYRSFKKGELEKYIIEKKKSIKTLQGYKPKIIESLYEGKALNIIDAFNTWQLLNKQNLDSDKIRAALYNKIVVPLFAIALLLILFFKLPFHARMMNIGSVIALSLGATFVIWGILFGLNQMSSNGVLAPEFTSILPIVLLWLYAIYVYITDEKSIA